VTSRKTAHNAPTSSFADDIRRVSSAPKADLRELFGRICFNAAVSNLDDDPRNQAVLGRDRSWRLSPTYDLTPTPAIAEERRDLAMTCGPYGPTRTASI
jgi:serine/threonine-protein kinase HipA